MSWFHKIRRETVLSFFAQERDQQLWVDDTMWSLWELMQQSWGLHNDPFALQSRRVGWNILAIQTLAHLIHHQFVETLQPHLISNQFASQGLWECKRPENLKTDLYFDKYTYYCPFVHLITDTISRLLLLGLVGNWKRSNTFKQVIFGHPLESSL